MGSENKTVESQPKINLFVVIAISTSCILVGILFSVTTKETDFWRHEVFSRLLIAGGSTGLAAGIIGMILNIPSFLEYFKKVLTQSLVSKEYLRELSESELKDVRDLTLKYIYSNENINSEESLIELDDQICNLLSVSYIDSYEVDIFCMKEGDDVRKKGNYSLTFINPSNDTLCVKEYLEKEIWMKSIENIENKDLRKITSLKLTLDGVETNVPISEVEMKVTIVEDDGFEGLNYKIILRLKLPDNITTKYESDAKIEIKEERIVPITDVTYVFRTIYPTKRFSLTYNLQNIDCYITGNLFGTLIKKRDYSIVKDDNSIYIRCNKWMLNGNGVVITAVPS